MANSYVEIPVTGVDSYAFPFPYIEQSHITVYAGGVLQTQGVHYTFTDSNTIEFSVGNVPTDTATVIVIQRVTDDSGRLVTYSNTGLDADDLNLGAQQNFFLAQEAIDVAKLNVTKGANGVISVDGRLTNVLDPIAPQDAATKAYVASQLTQSATGSVYIQDSAPPAIGLSVGDLWIDTDTGVMSVWTSTGWANGGTVESETFNYTGADLVPFGSFYIVPNFALGIANIDQVFLNGVLLKECTTPLDFTTGDWDRTSSVVTFNNALDANDVLTITTSARMSEILVNAVFSVNNNIDDILTARPNAESALQSKNDALTAQGLAEDAKDDAIVAKDDAIVAQGLAEDARDEAIAAADSISVEDGDYVVNNQTTVIAAANTSLRLEGGNGSNYIRSKNNNGGLITNVLWFDTQWQHKSDVVFYEDIEAQKGISLVSPDGLTTKLLSITNAGVVQLDGVDLSSSTGPVPPVDPVAPLATSTLIVDENGNNVLDDEGVMLTLESLGYTAQQVNTLLGDI